MQVEGDHRKARQPNLPFLKRSRFLSILGHAGVARKDIKDTTTICYTTKKEKNKSEAAEIQSRTDSPSD